MPERHLVLAIVTFILTIALIWFIASWLVRRRRNREIKRKIRDGNLWRGPIKAEDLGISKEDLEVISYHFDADEKVIRIFRRHPFVLWKVQAWRWTAAILFLCTILLAILYPAIPVPGPEAEMPGSRSPADSIAIWWYPATLILPALYAAVNEKEKWRWTIRAITTKAVYLLREQSALLPWAGDSFRPLAVHQIIAIERMSEKIGSIVDWGTLDLTVRADEHDDKPEHVIVDYVPDIRVCARQLRDVLPVYRDERSTDQLVTGDATGTKHGRKIHYRGMGRDH